MNIHSYVDGLDLSDGESHRGDCPVCRARGTFTAVNDYGTIKFNCYKLACSVRGLYDKDLTAAEVRMRMRPTQEPLHKEVETMEIPVYLVNPTFEHKKHTDFVLRWGIRHYPGLLYDVKQERTVFPILYKGRMIDAVGRAVGTRVQPKWYRYTGDADYFTVGTGDVVLLVEDVVSAIIAENLLPNITAMAILGTSMTPRHMEKVSEYRKAVIALDPDAMAKTILYRREIDLWTGIPTVAMNLHDDIKYKVPEDLTKLEEVCR
tara:strand:+ start:1828 stop:2613 length:786 start_codon:yes stop_codon:yes gene_type:complete